MARPSQQHDQALLRSGRALFAQHGCAGLSQRLVAGHAGVRPAMVHYHFGSKDGFLRAVLQQLYDELFAGLPSAAPGGGDPLATLRTTLLLLAGFVRQHQPLLQRLVADAAAGHAVVHHFLRDNAPRHLGLLMQLLQAAQQAGRLPGVESPLAGAVFLMGAVVAPLLVAPAVVALGPVLPGWPPGALGAAITSQVASDAAIGHRIDLALAALSHPQPAAPTETP